MIYVSLFFIIIGVSAYFAYLSMKDFYELPEGRVYGLFLLRNPNALNLGNLNKLQSLGIILSIERLYRGSKSALVLYAPKETIAKFPDLKPLELEDYSRAYNIDKKNKSGELWRQFVVQGGQDGFKVEKRELQVAPKMDSKLLSDFRKRKITPLGKDTLKMNAEELLSAILLPQ